MPSSVSHYFKSVAFEDILYVEFKVNTYIDHEAYGSTYVPRKSTEIEDERYYIGEKELTYADLTQMLGKEKLDKLIAEAQSDL